MFKSTLVEPLHLSEVWYIIYSIQWTIDSTEDKTTLLIFKAPISIIDT